MDIRHVEGVEEHQRRAGNYEAIPYPPTIVSSFDDMNKSRYPFVDWPTYSYRDAFSSPEKMLLDELSHAFEGATLKDDRLYTIRANYGVGIIPSMFGCDIILSGENYPWVCPLDSIERVKDAIRRGIPPLTKGLGGMVEETEGYFASALAPYKNLKRGVKVGIADNQGPFNIAAEMIGRDIYLEIYDHPDVIHDLLELVTETCIAFVNRQKAVVGEERRGCYNFMWHLSGGVRICEDNGLLLSPKMYEEFCARYNARLGEAFGGFTILLCGDIWNIWDVIISTPNLRGIIYWSENFEDLRRAYKDASDKRIPIFWYGAIPEEHLQDFPTGVLQKKQVRSAEEAERILNLYRRSKPGSTP
ncbi:MAG: hypothetical protein ACUVXI_01325 [bacterium]